MSSFSGYDSEVVGFDTIDQKIAVDSNSSTQTNFISEGAGTQTNFSKDCGCMTSSEDFKKDEASSDYHPGLNEFLRKVVPTMMEHLDETENDFLNNSSDSDEEEVLQAKLFQEIELKSDLPGLGAGDFNSTVLGISWSSAGNSLAVSVGQNQHENWCQHDGLIRVYTVKRAEQDKFVHSLDISEKNCVSVLKYHPMVAALLAYGTTTGEVVLCNLRNSHDDGMQLSSPSDCHGSKRVSGLQWADATLAHTFLTIQINKTGKRRGAADQILISSGSDGTINVWQVNANQNVFEIVISYKINGSKKQGLPDITCFDFVKTLPLRPCDEKISDDVFVVGTKTGRLYLCKIKANNFNDNTDPVYDELDGHPTCVLDIVFSYQKPGTFASISMDSELRVYDVNQNSPLKVICLDMPISCMAWLPSTPCVVVGASDKALFHVYRIGSGQQVLVEGPTADGDLTALAVTQIGSSRIAAGGSDGRVRVWDLPTRRIRLTHEDLQF